MLSEKIPNFPKGSVIVREKLLQATDQAPELLTVMVKREKGFNPAGGDWEFLVMNGAATKIQSRETVGSCQACHAKQKDQDFIFRAYRSADARF
jgi:hypothetical protein